MAAGTAEVERLLRQQVRQGRALLACGSAALDTGQHTWQNAVLLHDTTHSNHNVSKKQRNGKG